MKKLINLLLLSFLICGICQAQNSDVNSKPQVNMNRVQKVDLRKVHLDTNVLTPTKIKLPIDLNNILIFKTPASSIVIYNSISSSISIQVGESLASKLSSFIIASKEKWVCPINWSHPVLILPTKNQVPKKYNLQMSKTYMIRWNGRDKVYELVQLLLHED